MTVKLIRNYGLKEIVCAQFAHFYEWGFLKVKNSLKKNLFEKS